MRLIISKSRNPDLQWEGLLLRKDFQKRVAEIRYKWTSNKLLGIATAQGLYKQKEFQKEITLLAKEFDLKPNKKQALRVYVVEGYSVIDDSYLNEKGLVLDFPKEKSGLPTFTIGPETLFEDIQEAWDLLGEVVKLNKTRNKPRKNIRRDLRIFEVGINGGDIDEINKCIRDEFGDDLDRANTKKIFTEMCKLLNIPKRQRPKLVI